jgi:hypothetical protein
MKVINVVSHLMSSTACVALIVIATQHPDQIAQLSIGVIGGILISMGVTRLVSHTSKCKTKC